MSLEQGSGTRYQVAELFNLLSSTLSNVEKRRIETTSVVALLSLFNLFSILNLVQEQDSGAGALPADELGPGGTNDLISTLSGMLGNGGKVGPELLLNLLSKQGKKVNPQLLTTLLSLVGDSKSDSDTGSLESPKAKAEPPAEKRQGRGIF